MRPRAATWLLNALWVCPGLFLLVAGIRLMTDKHANQGFEVGLGFASLGLVILGFGAIIVGLRRHYRR